MTLGVHYDPDQWPHGLRCADCHHLFVEGDRYSERLESFTEANVGKDVTRMTCSPIIRPSQRFGEEA